MWGRGIFHLKRSTGAFEVRYGEKCPVPNCPFDLIVTCFPLLIRFILLISVRFLPPDKTVG